jgi:hypothetical protein
MKALWCISTLPRSAAVHSMLAWRFGRQPVQRWNQSQKRATKPNGTAATTQVVRVVRCLKVSQDFGETELAVDQFLTVTVVQCLSYKDGGCCCEILRFITICTRTDIWPCSGPVQYSVNSIFRNTNNAFAVDRLFMACYALVALLKNDFWGLSPNYYMVYF